MQCIKQELFNFSSCVDNIHINITRSKKDDFLSVFDGMIGKKYNWNESGLFIILCNAERKFFLNAFQKNFVAYNRDKMEKKISW